jgi:hypothetical protein
MTWDDRLVKDLPMKTSRLPSAIEPHLSARKGAQLQEMGARGMRANADYMNLLRDQLHSHRLHAAVSTLPRLKDHLSALADHLQTILDSEDPPSRLSASVPR